MITADLNWVEIELFGDLVEVHLKAITRLWCAVTSLRSARRFVCESAQSLEFVARHVISDCLQRARVERAGDAVAAVSAAIQERLEMHSRDRAIFLHTRFELHQDRMSASVTIKNFFTREGHFHGTSGDHRELTNGDLVIERIALAAKATTV